MINSVHRSHSQNYQDKKMQLTQDYCLQEEKLSVLGLRPLERTAGTEEKGKRGVQKEKGEEQKDGLQRRNGVGLQITLCAPTHISKP